ncbi:SH3 domain-containing protein [Mesorhizobium sp. NPDC059054]|uniref:SH3 domain-containing protein n=1 Tax=Mesorhizobium sp. NPDC059054 TaxID=3346711 RepID=UPI003692EEFE
MKRPLGFRAPRPHRISMQFGYNTRPSFWQKVQAQSHLVIAAVGTVALLSVAGTALWLALPSGERQAFAKHPVTAEASASEQSPEPAQVAEQKPEADPTPAAAAAKGPQVKPASVQTAAASAELSKSDPRWTNPDGTPKPQTTAAIQEAAKAVAVAKPGQDDPDATEQAYAEPENGSSPADAAIVDPPVPQAKPDKAATAGIPVVEEPEKNAEPAKASGNGTILRSVTMRSGPKKGAGVITTVPAKSSVDVISCGKHRWCEIVYQNKRGWIYQGFLNRG